MESASILYLFAWEMPAKLPARELVVEEKDDNVKAASNGALEMLYEVTTVCLCIYVFMYIYIYR